MDAVEKVKIALDETRMLVLGAQVLLGYQLRSAFEDGFAALADPAQAGDGIALLVMLASLGFWWHRRSSTGSLIMVTQPHASCA